MEQYKDVNVNVKVNVNVNLINSGHALSCTALSPVHRHERKQIFQINVTELRLPTGRSQTSWLFIMRDQGFDLGRVEALSPGPRDYNTSALNHSATPPPKHVSFNMMTLLQNVTNPDNLQIIKWYMFIYITNVKASLKVDQYQQYSLFIIEIHSNLKIVGGTRCKRNAIISELSLLCNGVFHQRGRLW